MLGLRNLFGSMFQVQGLVGTMEATGQWGIETDIQTSFPTAPRQSEVESAVESPDITPR
ncbi:uncharacterized protein METZ01_LOCUS209405 [marine metagenome]|jgi:hypothetical protein|uniref:Uncharacterized protein n=1 Tax=marine metagenome TaxID=408172 RepID=A0A382F344_9ZZZZ